MYDKTHVTMNYWWSTCCYHRSVLKSFCSKRCSGRGHSVINLESLVVASGNEIGDNLEPRVLRLLGQRWVAGKNSRDTKKIWLFWLALSKTIVGRRPVVPEIFQKRYFKSTWTKGGGWNVVEVDLNLFLSAPLSCSILHRTNTVSNIRMRHISS